MTQPNPKISVVIPTYQRQESLERCLSSLRHDRPEEIEVIVVDDGSPQPVRFNGHSYLFPVRLLRQAHLGPGVARNLGAKHSRGPILVFLDDDCTASDDFIEQCLSIFKNSEVSLLGAQILGSNTDNLMSQIKNARSKLNTLSQELIEVDMIPGCAYAIRKDIFWFIGGFDPAFHVHEDEDLWMRAKIKGITIYRSPKLCVTHHLLFRKASDFFQKALSWSTEETDMLFKKYEILWSSRDSDSYLTRLRVRYLSRKIFSHLLLLTLFSFAQLIQIVLAKWRDYRHWPFMRRLKGVYYELIWSAGGVWGYLTRYWREWAGSLFNRLGVIAEVLSYNIQYYISRTPTQLVLFVTNRCQANCNHCFYYDKLNTTREDLSLEEYDRISSNLGCLHKIYLSGGEPFLRDDLPEIAQIFYKRNRLKVLSIPTNGFNTERTVNSVSEILRRNPSLQLNVNVSLDGFEHTHDRIRHLNGSYRRAIATLRSLYAVREKYPKLRVGVNMTLMPDNQSEFMLFLAYLCQSEPLLNSINPGVAYLRMEMGLSKNRSAQLQMSETEWKRFSNVLGGCWTFLWKKPLVSLKAFLKAVKNEALFILYREAEHTKKQPVRCKAPKIFSVIRETGDVSFCEQRPSIGNVKNASLQAVLQSSEAIAEAESVRRGVCACSQCFFQEASLLSQPWHPSAIRLFLKGIVGVIKKIRR